MSRHFWMTVAMAATLAVPCAATAVAQSCQPALGHPPLARKDHLIAAINPTVAPIQYIDDEGNIVGLDPDLGNMIAKRLCLTMDFHSTQFATMIPILKEGRIDMINSFMYYTPERASQVLMVPYGASSMAIVVPKANNDKIEGPKYFSGKSMATELGTVDYKVAVAASDELKKEGKPGIDVRTFGTYADVLQALKAGQVEGAIIGTEQAVWYRNKGSSFFRIALSGYEPHAEALAFNDPKLAEAVVGALNELHKDGSLAALFNKYGHCLLPGPYKVTTGPIPTPVCKPIE
jgi:polar amino acid transport system substrate-binding protein